MKIVYLAAGSEGTLGGETRVALELAQAMSRLSETAIVYTGTKNEIRKEGGLIKVTLEGSDFEEKENIGVFTPNTIKFLFDFLDSFKPDIVHSHSAWLAPFIGQVWAINNNVPYFYTTHYMPSKISQFFDMTEDTFAYKMMNDMVLKQHLLGYMDNCACIVSLNAVSKEDLVAYGYKGNIEIIPNGRDIKPLNALNFANQKSKERVIGFVGSITKRKNQEFLVKVTKYLPNNYKLKLVGRYLFDGYEDEFKKLVKKHPMVEIVGPIDPKKVTEFLEGLHIFVSASKAEVQALSIIEALAAGRPIVGLSNETIDELVDSSNGVSLGKGATPKEFAKEVLKIGKLSQSSYDTLCNNARNRVAHMDWEEIAQRTHSLYEEYSSQSTVENRIGSLDNLSDMVVKLPYFPGQSYLIKQIHELSFRNYSSKPLNTLRKVPKKTLLFAGLTLGVATAAYGVVKAVQFARKVRKKG